MEENSNILLGIKIPTQELSSGLIQEVLTAVRKQGQTLQINRDFWNDMTKTLWHHLQTGLEKFDDQLLCATCFYGVLTLSDEQEFYLNEISGKIKLEIGLKENSLKSSVDTLQAVSLMYGMFQSSYLKQDMRKEYLDNLLQVIFELLIVMAYEYSKYTFIVFKTINAFKKICGTDLQGILFNHQNKIKLLNLVNHNWENPITGVRDLNKSIFQTLISVMDDQMYDYVLKEINEFYWNKAKYLMLTEIICQSNQNIILTEEYDWINGLVNSLYKPGLVSAGADMYFSILKKMKSEEQWCQIFMKPIVGLLCGDSLKGIENFCNYWCITTFKKYPLVAEMILKELEVSNQENTLYSSLFLMKQANKLCLLNKNWDTTVGSYVESCILKALEHCDNQLRMMAFDVVCVSHCKSLQKIIEFELVLNFLISNVNSDCTVLRICMLKSFSSFLTQIHMSYLNYSNDSDGEIENLQYFCAHFQNFIINNIQLSGNYQRKITCIKLVHTFMKSLKEVPRKNLKQTRKSNKTIIQMLEDKGLWLMFEDTIIMNLLRHLKDPAQDVRDNAGLLLLEHYTEVLINKDLIDLLIEEALKSISSKFFYEISCGQSMFKLIVNILICEKQIEAKFNTVDDVLNFTLKEIIKEYQLNRGIVESIEKGKQLHSLISVLHTVLEVCYERKHIINISEYQYHELIEVLEGISNQFAWEKETSTSSDFSKISDMINGIIVTSGYDKKVDFDQTKISGLHQIVLSCLWFNVKASCELLSLLIKYQDDIQIEICEKSLDVICHVLETCRHKGAIEAAGAALGQSIQHLTSLPEDTALSRLPLSFLKTKLDELISEAARMASVTRRGAGLSIMVHRVVSSDAKRGKPLFHYFMKTILDTCIKAEFIPSAENIDNEKDLPKAIYIHFLTRIVTDSSLASDMMFYSAELAELAFGNLTSPYWQIRNAALQLYGALIQKLIGQKKAAGAEEETIATVACDELRTHSPKLWQHIMNQLQNKIFDDKVQYHSNLIPILNMLANIARRYSFSFDIIEHKKTHSGLLDSLILLLDSPIFTVRRLSAKCIFNIFSNEEIVHNLLSQNCSSENYIHGSLLLIANILNLHGSKDINQTMINRLKVKYAVILNAKEHSYLCREIFDDIFFDESYVVDSVQKTLVELETKSRMPGVFLWANKQIQKYLYYAPWDMVHELLQIILIQNESETYLSILHDKIEKEKNVSQRTLLDLANVLISSENKFNSFFTWKILYEILLKIDQTILKVELFDLSEIFVHIEETGVLYKLRYMIPFAARLSALGVEKNKVQDISSIINRLTDPETTDVEMRLIAAMANNELCLDIKNLPEPVKITVVKSAVVLLQDEDEDIRMLCAKFYPIAIDDVKKSMQPYICLRKITDHKFLYTFFSKNGVCTLRKELMVYLTKVCSRHVDEYNPFANVSCNIYLEVDVFRQIIENL